MWGYPDYGNRSERRRELGRQSFSIRFFATPSGDPPERRAVAVRQQRYWDMGLDDDAFPFG
jgi:hypothetical protein